MRFMTGRSLAILTIAALTIGTAQANTCQAGKLTCPTKMPVGGFCECTAQGNTKDGTVVSKPAPRRKVNAAPGGCGVQPNAPGCR